MKTFTRVAIATLTMVGMAAAQPKTDAKAGSGAGSAAGAKVDAKAGAKTDAKAGAKVDAKAGAAPAAAEMAAPKPAAEIADMKKMMAGTWRCTGTTSDMKGVATPMKATMKTKADLDGFWIHDSFTGTAGKMKYTFETYTTFDASAKKWRRVMLDNMGGQMIGTSDGMKDGKMDFNLDTMSPMGASMFKDHLDASDAKAGLKSWGEMSMDKGKTWSKVYEMTCKK